MLQWVNSAAHPLLHLFAYRGRVATHTCSIKRVWSVIHLSPHNRERPDFLNKVDKLFFFLSICKTIGKENKSVVATDWRRGKV